MSETHNLAGKQLSWSSRLYFYYIGHEPPGYQGDVAFCYPSLIWKTTMLILMARSSILSASLAQFTDLAQVLKLPLKKVTRYHFISLHLSDASLTRTSMRGSWCHSRERPSAASTRPRKETEPWPWKEVTRVEPRPLEIQFNLHWPLVQRITSLLRQRGCN